MASRTNVIAIFHAAFNPATRFPDTFETPPRHVGTPDDLEDLTHGYGETLPW